MTENIVADGFGTVFFLTSLPFFLLRYGQSSVTAVALVFGVGGFLGLVSSYPMGVLADRRDRKALLETWQVVQVFVSLPLVLFAVHKSPLILAVSAACVVAASRMQAVVRDTVRADYIDPERRISFNTSVRSKFLVANSIAAFCALGLAGIIDTEFYWVFPVVNIASFIFCGILTWLLPKKGAVVGGATSAAGQFALRGMFKRPLIQSLLALAVLPSMANLETIGLSSWVADTRAFPVYLLTVISTTCLVVELVLQNFLKDRLEVGNRLWRSSRFRVLGSALLAFVAFFSVSRMDFPVVLAIGVSLFGAICATYCYLMSIIFGMSLQYWLGRDSDRGKISAIFRIAQALSIVVGGLFAPVVFFGHPAVVFVLGAGFCWITLLLPTGEKALSELRSVFP